MNPSEPNTPKDFTALSTDSIEALTEQSDLAVSLNKMGHSNHKQGKHAEAEAQYKQAIASSEKVAGDDQSDLSQSLNNLANLYYEQGKFIQSEPLCKRALVMREKALGPDHPDVAESLILYAKLLRKKNFNYKAAQLEVRAKSILRKRK